MAIQTTARLIEKSGSQTVTTAGTAVALDATSTEKVHSVTIGAFLTNTGNIYSGPSTVDSSAVATQFHPMAAGYEMERTALPGYHLRLSDIYIDADVNGEGVNFTYWVEA